jgi:tetratricopeptide (TPR) repeat protein
MKTVNDSKKTANILLGMSIDKLLNEEARNAVEDEDINRLHNIDLLVKRYFSKTIVRHQFEKLARFNKLLVDFLAWFEWGGEIKWKEGAPIVNKWKTILELSQLISLSESTQKAYQEIIKTANGEMIVALLHEKKMMKPAEIKENLELKSIEGLSSELSILENIGIIVREVEGKELQVYLTPLGIEVYSDYIKPKTKISQLLSMALKEIETSELQKAKKTLLRAKKIEPDNPFAFFLLGIIALEEEDLSKAGDYLVQAVKFGLDKEKTFLYFSNLEKMKKLDLLKNRIWELNTQMDEISMKVRPTLRILGLLNEYLGDSSNATVFKYIYASITDSLFSNSPDFLFNNYIFLS